MEERGREEDDVGRADAGAQRGAAEHEAGQPAVALHNLEHGDALADGGADDCCERREGGRESKRGLRGLEHGEAPCRWKCRRLLRRDRGRSEERRIGLTIMSFLFRS